MKDEIQVAKATGRGDDLMRIINKSAIAPATTTTDADIIGTDFGNYLGWLAPDSAAARMIGLGLNFPIRQGSFKVPNRDTAPATLPWVGEADPIAVRDATFANVTMAPKQMAAISVISREVAKQGGVLRGAGARNLTHLVFGRALLARMTAEELERRAESVRAAGTEPLSENGFRRRLELLAPVDGSVSRQSLIDQSRLAGATIDMLALFDAFDRQTDRDFEVLLIDSGSFDNSREIAGRRGARILRIPKHDFTFGYSLNVGIEAGEGSFMAIVSAHAIPTDEHWLARLTAPLEDENVAMTYGRQVGVASSKFSEAEDFDRVFGPRARTEKPGDFRVNNANSAIRKADWQTYPFNEELTGLEDIAYAR